MFRVKNLQVLLFLSIVSAQAMLPSIKPHDINLDERKQHIVSDVVGNVQKALPQIQKKKNNSKILLSAAHKALEDLSKINKPLFMITVMSIIETADREKRVSDAKKSILYPQSQQSPTFEEFTTKKPIQEKVKKQPINAQRYRAYGY